MTPSHVYMRKSNTFTDIDQAFLVSEILCVVALCLSKCSTFALITRVLRPVRVGVDLGWIMCISSLMLSIIWGIGSVVGLAMFCDPSTIMSDPENTGCPGHVSSRRPSVTASEW